MSWTRFLRRDRWDDERARELEAHLAIETDENLARGMTPAEARAAAHRKLGNITRVREEIYQMNTLGVADTAWRDFKYAARVLRLNPGFTLIAILSLALGIGANTAIFQLLDALRMRALPVPHAEQLAEITIGDGTLDRSGSMNGNHAALTNALWERIRDRQQAFSGVFAWASPTFELSSGGESRKAEGLWAGGDLFGTLGVHAAIGRLFTAADDYRGCAAPPAVISYGFWQREFGGDASALTHRLTLDGHPFDIVGVTPPDFFGVEVGRTFDVAVPLCAEALSLGAHSWLDRKDAWFLGAIGRLKPGWSIEKAGAHLRALSAPLFKETLPNYRPEDEKIYLAYTLSVFPAGTGVSSLRHEYGPSLWLLLATTGLVLVIACANLANLMLARATTREREIAVRLALGASRARVIQQLLAESLLIAAAGAALGALLAQSLSRVLVAALTTQHERVFMDVTGDWRVFAFVALLAASACVIFGLVPAIRATAASPGAAMKAGSRGSTDSRQRFGLRRALVVAQVALSLVLVVGALLFVRSFRNLVTLDAGFRQDHVFAATIDLRRTGMPDTRIRAALDDLIEKLRRVPGVDSAAQVRNVPIGGSFSNRNIVVDGVTRTENVNYNSVGDQYFTTMGAPLLAGRDFDRHDDAGPRVAIVTESFARVFFGGGNPVGRTFQIDEAPGVARPAITIVGLARDAKYNDLRDPFEPLIYVPIAQDALLPSVAHLVVRSTGSPAGVIAAVTSLARDLDPAGIVTLRSMESQIRDSLVRERLMATLSGAFGGLAALLATIGLYGVMSYTVARRRNEIGIRMALGADRGQVIAMVMREAGLLLGAGVIAGTALAMIAGPAAATLLFGLAPSDPSTLAMAVGGLGVVAMLASYLPALRASRLEPTEALREE
jgi:putative ABC transport system permease protein